MPIVESKDDFGKYFQFGKHGTKYYYFSEKGRKSAYKSCLKQARAIKANTV